jgi:hypothetical protein
MDPGHAPHFAVIDDRTRLPWRFLERHIAVDGLGADV